MRRRRTCRSIQEIITVTRLGQIIDIRNSESEGIEAFE